jgi:adenosylcobalamin-dependent ribonucleoside-triphosphate reductase
MSTTPSIRAQIITRRTYCRPQNAAGTIFETWEEVVDRVIYHQRWLWERARDEKLLERDLQELAELRALILDRKVFLSGRTLWLGGTETARTRESSMFNCSFTNVESIYDMVDVLWLLLQGCGVGFKPIVGQLTGFQQRISKVTVIRSTRTEKGGDDNNLETFDEATGVWTIRVGDSAEAWAKSIGKLVAHKFHAKELVLDFSQIRPAGERLKGYGWISSGDAGIAKAYQAIAAILNRRSSSLLTRIDILDVVNWMGTILSTRRSAEIALFDYGEAEWSEFATAKKEFWVANPQRAQSNNSLLFKTKPSRSEMEHIFDLMVKSGGSEPGFINGKTATERAPWFKGVNPCAEILLGNKSFCNLTEVDIGRFHGDSDGLRRAVHLASRANYRQTCVNLKDGILQEAWDLMNSFLRLCGVGLTGIARRPDMTAYDYADLQRTATAGAYGMADELGLPRPKNVTTVKPSGTLSKIMDTTEGIHKPLGRYIFNNVNFSKHDPLVKICREAGYRVFPNPMDVESVLITFPVKYDGVPFEKVIDASGNEKEVNLESALDQLNRYKMLMDYYVQQNASATISYAKEEVPAIIDWLLQNWDSYVGVSFLFRNDPSKTAKDLGYLYLPQEVVTKDTYDAYVKTVQQVTLDASADSLAEMDDTECAGGVCPRK